MHKWIFIMGVGLSLLATTLRADEDNATSVLQAGGYLGAHLSPTNATMALQLDYALNRYLSIGPLLQLGIWNHRSYFTLTGGGTFNFPWEYNGAVWVAHWHAGAGYFYRYASSLGNHSFVFTTGPGLDVPLNAQWALSSWLLANISNDIIDDFFLTALVGIKLRF